MNNKNWKFEVRYKEYEKVKFSSILAHIKENNAGIISIGTDSFTHNRWCTFATAICTHSPGAGNGKYFFCKDRTKKSNFRDLFSRISEEVSRSLALAESLIEAGIKSESIKIHIDVSPSASNTKTSNFAEALRGYVKGCGFECEIKPNAWAAANVADRHSKK